MFCMGWGEASALLRLLGWKLGSRLGGMTRVFDFGKSLFWSLWGKGVRMKRRVEREKDDGVRNGRYLISINF